MFCFDFASFGIFFLLNLLYQLESMNMDQKLQTAVETVKNSQHQSSKMERGTTQIQQALPNLSSYVFLEPD